MVFSESAIEALIKFQPQTLEEVVVVPELTQRQAEKYGEKISNIIKSWKNGTIIKISESTTPMKTFQSPNMDRKRSSDDAPFLPLKRKSLSPKSSESIQQVSTPTPKSSTETPTSKVIENKKTPPPTLSNYHQEIWKEFVECGSIPKICETRLLRISRVEDIITSCISSGYPLPISSMGISPETLSSLEKSLHSPPYTLARLLSCVKSLNLPISEFPSWKLQILRAYLDRLQQ